MPIQAADIDTVFEAVLDRTAYLKANGKRVLQARVFTPGATGGTFHAETQAAEIFLIGGGGGGGGYVTATAGATMGGGGGGSSGGWREVGLIRSTFLAGAAFTVSVGVGGTAGSATAGTSGSDGGATSFDTVGFNFRVPGGKGGGGTTTTAGGVPGVTTGVFPPAVSYARGGTGGSVAATAGGAADYGYNVNYTHDAVSAGAWGSGGNGYSQSGGFTSNGQGGKGGGGAFLPFTSTFFPPYTPNDGAPGAVLLIEYFDTANLVP